MRAEERLPEGRGIRPDESSRNGNVMPNLSVRAEEMEGARILVTGGAGFIGSHLVDHLVARNEVTVIDDLSTGTLRNLGRARGRVHVKKASVLETDTLATAMKGQQIVYHLAAKTSAPYSGVMAKFCAAVAANRPLEIYGDGEQTRDFLFVADIAEGLELAGVKSVNGATLNLGSGEAITVNDVVRNLSEIVGRPIRAVREPERPGDIRHSRADVSKAKEKLGFTARTTVREGLKKTLEDARKRAAHAS